jgi:hypothetical protein
MFGFQGCWKGAPTTAMKGHRKKRRGCPNMRSALELSNRILYVVGLRDRGGKAKYETACGGSDVRE